MLTAHKPVVYLVDDDEMALRYVAAALESAGLVTQSFTDPHAFLDECQTTWRGCVLLDLNMPQLPGPAVQAGMHARGVLMPIVFLTGTSDVATAVSVMKQGAVDLIEKPADATLLLQRVQKALALDLENETRRCNRAGLIERRASLSPREREVLELVAAGLANKQVAYQLKISERTVEVHRSRVMSKMQVQSVAELVLAWREIADDSTAAIAA